MAIVLVLPSRALYAAYTIYCHGRFGQTLGKHFMGIRVVLTTGERIDWREAWLRSSVDVMLALLGIIASFVALSTIADADYYGVEMEAAEPEPPRSSASLAWMDRDGPCALDVERGNRDVV